MKFKLAGIACILIAPILLFKIWETGFDKSYIAANETIFMICLVFIKIVLSLLAAFMLWYGYQLLFNTPTNK